jgi:beta-mannosidase
MMKQVMSLDGKWSLTWRAPDGEPSQDFLEAPVGPWQARVPGEVHWDLLQAESIADPFFGTNADHCQWMDAVDWWYERTFALPEYAVGHQIELFFEGLDTTADVWLNGHHVGHHNNMFVPYVIDVSPFVVEGENRLSVRLDCGLRAVADKSVEPYNKMPTVGDLSLPRMWVRKAQFTFGWDWAPPRLLTCGIWRPVHLTIHDAVAIREPCLRARLVEGDSAIVDVTADLDNLTLDPIDVTIEVGLVGEACHKRTIDRTLAPGQNFETIALTLQEPRLWWPRPVGEPYLYQSYVQVSHRGGQILDRYEAPYGIREVVLDQSPQPEGKRSFTFVVNGVPVFASGANWAPADSLLPRMVSEKYETLIEMALDQNVNCLRIWGGGMYEDPLFYDLCDRYGIMVWQDFMFACCYYPDDDEEFCREIQRESEIIVKQLRNHPCLVLWCGNNENQWLHQERQREGNAADRMYGENLYDVILPEVCRRLDPERPYWPSSPYGGEDSNSPDIGDRHLWNVGDPPLAAEERVRFSDYAEDRGRFISEFGVLSATPLETLREFLPEQDLDPTSASWKYHQNWFDMGAVEAALRLYWRDPSLLALDEYVIMSQVIQAEALKFALEHCRRRKYACSGALYWMLADCWGTSTSWATIDYYLRPKPSYYYVKRAFAPVLLSFAEEEDSLGVWLTNDTLEPHSGQLRLVDVNLRTGACDEWCIDARIEANASKEVTRYSLQEIPPSERSGHAFHAQFSSTRRVMSRSRHLLVGFHLSDLLMPDVHLTHKVEALGNSDYVLKVSSDRYAWMVHLDAGPEVWLEDNYFDLLPGEERRIRLRGEPFQLAELRVLHRAP